MRLYYAEQGQNYVEKVKNKQQRQITYEYKHKSMVHNSTKTIM